MLQATIGARDDKRSDEETAAGPDFTTHPSAKEKKKELARNSVAPGYHKLLGAQERTVGTHGCMCIRNLERTLVCPPSPLNTLIDCVNYPPQDNAPFLDVEEY
ncbi:Hypothetical protein BQ9382_C4-1472 [Komagataella phaffii CBS 7435]|nr:Hypothetical protein BQ9382_C4-1472 [Komagataella phaffii CBS 7435]